METVRPLCVVPLLLALAVVAGCQEPPAEPELINLVPPPAAPDGCAEVTTVAEFEAHLKDETRPTLVYFYAPGCPHCALFSPTMGRLAADYGDSVAFLRASPGHVLPLYDRYEIPGTPSVVILALGEVVAREIGAAEETVLRSALDRAIRKSKSGPAEGVR